MDQDRGEVNWNSTCQSDPGEMTTITILSTRQ